MLILPAIDIRGGRCVRLRQGDYAQETVFSEDPAAMARHWVTQGAAYLHLVDLDGAKAGRPVNVEAIRRIVETAGVPCQLGGGLRTTEDVDAALSWGLDRVVVGTRAVREPDWLEEVCQRCPGKIVLGLDARNGLLATDGWLGGTGQTAADAARAAAHLPLAAIVYTDIARDGMLEGPNFDAIAELLHSGGIRPQLLIASGGVTTLDDIRQLAAMNLDGCIVGRALYEERLDLKTILQMMK